MSQSQSNFARLSSMIGRFEAIGIVAALLLLCVFLTLSVDTFATSYNMTVVIRQASFVGIIALGQTLVLLIGGIDLSVGAGAGLSAIFGALLLTSLGVHPYLVIPLTCMFGFALGTINGALVAYARLNPFIVTLALPLFKAPTWMRSCLGAGDAGMVVMLAAADGSGG